MSTSGSGVAAGRVVQVLVGDDDRRVRAALVRLLTVAGGFDVTAATRNPADDVVQIAAALRPDVAVIDLLPDPPIGLQIVATLSQLHVSVVAMSAHGGLRTAALSAGANAFITKDGQPEVLLDAVRSAVAHPSQPLTTS